MKLQLPDFTTAKVLVVGDLMLDRYWHGATARISPEAPVPVVNINNIEHRLGGAGNVALNIRALAANVTALGWIGPDEAGTLLQQTLQQQGIKAYCLPVAGHATVTKLRIISRQQQLIRLDFEDGFAAADPAILLQHYQQELTQADTVILSDYGKGTLTAPANLIQAARALNKPVLIDPKGQDFSRYRGATLLTPNQAEFTAVVGQCDSVAQLIERGMNLITELDLSALLVTRSEKGMLLLQREQVALELPTHAREVYDVTGAGDTVIATLASGLAAGLSLTAATRLANLAAGIVVGKLGTATANCTELQAAMLQHEPLQRGIVQQAELQQMVQTARQQGERIVFTNGCFDILHAGHVNYLSRARELGDRLIVAVNDDASVKRLKGQERPINALAQRMQVLAALASVDWVVPFSEDTPAELIATLLPDVLVKGGDYQVAEIVGADTVTAAGGEVVVLDFLPGCSTTSIIEAIKQEQNL